MARILTELGLVPCLEGGSDLVLQGSDYSGIRLETFVQVVAYGFTLGAMYAVSTIGLALVYSALNMLNMLNMSQGALLAFGGYVCFHVMETLGLAMWRMRMFA